MKKDNERKEYKNICRELEQSTLIICPIKENKNRKTALNFILDII